LLAASGATVNSSTVDASNTENQILNLHCDVPNASPKARFDDSTICIHFMPMQIKVTLALKVDSPYIARIEGTYDV